MIKIETDLTYFKRYPYGKQNTILGTKSTRLSEILSLRDELSEILIHVNYIAMQFLCG